MAKDILV